MIKERAKQPEKTSPWERASLHEKTNTEKRAIG